MEKSEIYNIAKKISCNNEPDEIQKTYVRIEGIIKKLKELDGFNIDIFEFPKDEIISFIKSFVELLDVSKGKLVLNRTERDTKLPNKMFLDRIKKDKPLDVENCIDHFIELGEEGKSFKSALHSSHKVEAIKRANYEKLRNLEFQSTDFCDSFNIHFKAIRDYYNSSKEEIIFFKNNKSRNPKIEMQVLNLVENSFSNLFFITINHIITEYQGIAKKSVKTYLREIKNELSNISSKQFQNISSDKENLNIIFARYLYYIDRRNELKLYENIFTNLLEQSRDKSKYLCKVNEKYKSQNRTVSSITIKKDLIEILTEGKGEKYSRFNKKLKLTNRLVRSNLGLNDKSLLHMKMAYREIFFDKRKFRNKLPKSIVENMEFNKRLNEYTFSCVEECVYFGEKLCRASYREHGLINEYIRKTCLKLSYIKIIHDIYSTIEIEIAWNKMDYLMEHLGLAIMRILSSIDQECDPLFKKEI